MTYTPPSTNPTPTMVTTGLNAESNFFQISRISCRQRVYDGWMLRTGGYTHDAVDSGEMSARPHTDQLTRVTTHVPFRFCSIHRWLPMARPGVESSDDGNVVR